MDTQVRSPHTQIFTQSHTPAAVQLIHMMLLLSVAEVIAEVVVAWRFGDGWSTVWDRNVLKIEETELDFHGEEDLQLTAHGLAIHLPAQENIQSVCPQAELIEKTWLYSDLFNVCTPSYCTKFKPIPRVYWSLHSNDRIDVNFSYHNFFCYLL